MGTLLFDLNQLPNDENIESINNSQNEEILHDIPLFLHSHSTNNFVIDIGEDEDISYRTWDLNVDFIDDDQYDENSGDDISVQSQEQSSVGRNRKLFLTNSQRENIYRAFLERSHRGKLKRNTTTEVSALFSVPIRTIQRIWKLGKTNGGDVKIRKRIGGGTNSKARVDLRRIMEVDLKQRTTLRSLAEALGVSHSLLHRLFKEGLIHRHSNAIKPHLKEEHKRARLQFCLSMLDPSTLPNNPKFLDMYNIVHIDEKWFYLTKKSEKYYLHPMEADPLRTCQSKNYIGKVMFLVAMARPRFDVEGNEIFSGKIGMFPLVTTEPAIRRSRNREAGTMVTKPIPSVTREVIKKFLIEKVVPNIQALWPIEDRGKTIWIQQDNARTHISADDPDFLRVASQNGFDIRLTCQPANSLDLNILDLGFFSAIQSLQQKKKANNVDELINAVEKSFEEYSTIKINRTWRILKAREYVEQVTSNCEEVQNKVLSEILNQNAEVEYLKRHGISKKCMDREFYKTNVPLVTYDDIKPDIQRYVNGDFTPTLCATPFSEFFSSSGTSEGQPKLIPTTNEDMKRRHMFYSLPTVIISKYVEGLNKGKALRFIFTWNGTTTPGGLTARPVLTCYYTSHYFEDTLSDPYFTITSPLEAIRCHDNFQSMYTQLLCGLYQRQEVVRIEATFAQGIVSVIDFFRRHYSELCDDISTGQLSPKITDVELRARMLEAYVKQPEVELADFIKQICEGENWEGIVRKIWPNAKYIETILTGFAEQYLARLDYYCGKIVKVSPRYSSSECALGLNLNPMCDPNDISYTLMPNMAYFEFLPLDSHGSNGSSKYPPQPVELANVEVGKEYELVITTYTGLYRYKMGDVLCPIGFYNKAPQFKYMRRKNVALCVYVENTTESELHSAVNKASIVLQSLSTTVVEYTSYVDVNTNPGHYVIFWELSKDLANDTEKEVIEKCCSEMEETFGCLYKRCRTELKSIGPVEIRVVKHGTFEKLREYAMSKGASPGQYKVPRCLKLNRMVDLMNSGVRSAYFSPSLPHYPSN